MKTVKMQGGLGNQLFCLAFARSVARISREPVALDLASFGADRYGRAFDLEDLAVRLGGFDYAHRSLESGRVTSRLLRALPVGGFVAEGAAPGGSEDLAALIARGRYFDGYWQNEIYIDDPEGLIAGVRDYALARAEAGPVREIAIHYRTYKEEVRPEARGTPGGGYVRAAIDHIETRLGPAEQVCLVSDDPDLALERIGDVGREIAIVRGGGAWDDMALLMRAQALILTNSSFSWWGGYCGEASTITWPRREAFVHYAVPAARFEVV